MLIVEVTSLTQANRLTLSNVTFKIANAAVVRSLHRWICDHQSDHDIQGPFHYSVHRHLQAAAAWRGFMRVLAHTHQKRKAELFDRPPSS